MQTVTELQKIEEPLTNGPNVWTLLFVAPIYFQLKWPFGKLTEVPSVQSASDSHYVTLDILIIALV